MAVAAHHRGAGLGQPQLRPDDVNDALFGVAHRVQTNAELFTIATQRLDLGARHRVGDRFVDVDRRHVVVLGGDGQVGPTDRAAMEPETVERLWAGHLMHEMQVDVDEIGLARVAVAGTVGNDVVVPHFFCQRARLFFGGHLDFLTFWDASISL